jgi:DNA-binding GntR family transcriptional regulator
MEAYEFIRNAIIEGDYEPGMRLTEEFLAAELQLSRTPIREALKRLQTEGLITPLKRGLSVRTFSPQDIQQIYDLRALLEGYAASQAALLRSEHDVQVIKKINLLYAQAINRFDHSHAVTIKEIARLNNRYHEAILAASHNNHIEFLISKVVVLPLVFRSFFWYDQPAVKQSLLDHQIILRAIELQDPDRAKTAMMEHIYKGRDHVLLHLSEISDKEEETL